MPRTSSRLRRQVERVHWLGLSQRLAWEDLQPFASGLGYEPHPGQIALHRDRSPVRTVVCGRRWGKSYAVAFEAICVALLGGHVALGAPSYDLASIVWGEVVRRLTGSTFRSTVVHMMEAEGKQRLATSTGGLVYVRTTDNRRGFIGRAPDLVVIDEAAREPDGLVYHQDIVPSLLDHQGSALIVSTPAGEDWVKDLFDKGVDREAGHSSHRGPTAQNPHITRAALARLVEGMTERDYRQEILAEFMSDVGAVFRGYRDAATSSWEDGPVAGHRYVIGVDLALERDWTVAVVYDATECRVVAVERYNQVSYSVQEDRIVRLAQHWGAGVLVDATSNERVYEALADRLPYGSVQPYKFTLQSKAHVVNQIAYAIERGEMALLSLDQGREEESTLARTVLSELAAYRYERTPGGTVRTNAPSGKHDDCVIALALAFEMATRAYGGVPIVGPKVSGAGPVVSVGGRKG